MGTNISKAESLKINALTNTITHILAFSNLNLLNWFLIYVNYFSIIN